MRLNILYFAWLRERIGAGAETVEAPPEIATIGALVGWLQARDERHAAAFARPEVIRCAVNQDFATSATPLSAGDEVAFFPPVTGG